MLWETSWAVTPVPSWISGSIPYTPTWRFDMTYAFNLPPPELRLYDEAQATICVSAKAA